MSDSKEVQQLNEIKVSENADRIKTELRELVLEKFTSAGWTLEDGKLIPPTIENKDQLRSFHYTHRLERAEKERKIVEKYAGDLIQEFADGREVDPASFSPDLIQVKSTTWESRLFRFASLLWSVPISQGYGRRMRYLVKDKSNGKLVGLIALGDPVFNLKARDEDIGWNQSHRRERLYNVLDAFGLGAVPPYNRLLCGKFIALTAVSNEIREDFRQKYTGRQTIIQEKEKDPSLVLVTTTSALGRSSIYNRIKLPNEDQPVYRSVGFSSGFGHFHITDKIFNILRDYLRSLGDSYADAHRFGDGPSWRLRTIRQALDLLGFEENLLRHGIKREVFMMPLAKNYREYLLGEETEIDFYDRKLGDLTDYFKERWMIPRSERISDWMDWKRADTWSEITKNCDMENWGINLKLF